MKREYDKASNFMVLMNIINLYYIYILLIFLFCIFSFLMLFLLHLSDLPSIALKTTNKSFMPLTSQAGAKMFTSRSMLDRSENYLCIKALLK